MKNKQKDKLMQIVKILLTILFGVFVLYLLSFLVINDDIDKINSTIPTLDTTKLDSVVSKINERQDVQTDGKPDISKFNFGNSEPF